jgi:zinc protease
VPAAELAKAKRQIEVDLLRGADTAHALGSRIARDWVTFGRIRPIEERLAAYRAVTAADVQRVARAWLRPEARNVLQLVPPPPGVSLEEPTPTPPAPAETREDPAPLLGDGR